MICTPFDLLDDCVIDGNSSVNECVFWSPWEKCTIEPVALKGQNNRSSPSILSFYEASRFAIDDHFGKLMDTDRDVAVRMENSEIDA